MLKVVVDKVRRFLGIVHYSEQYNGTDTIKMVPI
jgi:hypothetical protein